MKQESSSRFRIVMSVLLRVFFFVFLILGLPVLILLPTAGFDLPDTPLWLERGALSALYGSLILFSGLGIVIMLNRIRSAMEQYRHHGWPVDQKKSLFVMGGKGLLLLLLCGWVIAVLIFEIYKVWR